MNIREHILKSLRQSSESFTLSESNSIVERITSKLCIDEHVDISSNTQKIKIITEMVDNVVAIKRAERIRSERSKQGQKYSAGYSSEKKLYGLNRRHNRHSGKPYTDRGFGEHGDYEANIPVVARMNNWDMQEAILQFLMNANLKAHPLPSTQEADVSVSSNQEFWDLVTARQRRIGLKWIKLDGFSLLDWFPRSPGLYYTNQARKARDEARNYLRVQEDCLVYEPEGKVHMINGGVGSLRFKPTRILDDDCWLCTATSDSYCHTGIPLALTNELFINWDYDYQHSFEIIGQIRYVPELLEEYYSHLSNIPQFYILVETIKRLRVRRDSPCLISPLVFFSTLESSEKFATFVNCRVEEDLQLSEAADWISDYIKRFSGKVLTNYDQQLPHFRNAPFALDKLMNGQITIHDVGRLDIGHANLVCETVQKIQSMEATLIMNNQGDVYNVGQAGAVGKYARSDNNTFIQGQKQTLARAAEEIQNLLKQLEQTNPNATETDKVAYVNDETTPSFKRRVVGALQAGGEAAIEEFLDNPYVSVGKAVVKGWMRPD